tara:strand:- start:445 stop:642 length:198 start_codon:yes stop_codon:yes gene_type:complete
MGLIFNKQRKTKREAREYYHTTVLYAELECDILLTENDVKRGIYRAKRNQEDIPVRWYEYFLFWR